MTKNYGRAMKEVHFDSESHISVLFQMYGSVWPKVFPYCVANALLTGIIYYLLRYKSTDLTFSDKGHTFMSLLVSFLVVSRAQIVYGRFMEARAHLSTAMRACREIVHHAAILTLYHIDKNAQEWRYEVAFRTILLLRVLCAAIEHQSSSKNSWEIPEILPEERSLIQDSLILDPEVLEREMNNLGSSGGGSSDDCGDEEEGGKKASEPRTVCPSSSPKPSLLPPSSMPLLPSLSKPPLSPPPTTTTFRSQAPASPVRLLAHGARSIFDENLRVPVLLAYQLREAIVSQRKRLKEELHVNEELKILSFVSEFNVAYHGLRKLITTPFPFPLVQMARTFLFFWIFTLPFCLVGDILKPFEVMIIIFLLTYGFLGLEYVSMELDDPFGDDPNNFDDLTMAQVVFEDIYITINEIDGRHAADKLRFKVKNKEHVGTKFESFVAGDDLFHDLGMMTTSSTAIGAGGRRKRGGSINGFGTFDTVFEGAPLLTPLEDGGGSAGNLTGVGGDKVVGQREGEGEGPIGVSTNVSHKGSFGRSWFSNHALGIIGGGGGVNHGVGVVSATNHTYGQIDIPESINEGSSSSSSSSSSSEDPPGNAISADTTTNDGNANAKNNNTASSSAVPNVGGISISTITKPEKKTSERRYFKAMPKKVTRTTATPQP